MGIPEHPTTRRSDGFAGLRIVPETPDVVCEPFTVQITVEDGIVSLAWDPQIPDVNRQLRDLGEVVRAAWMAIETDEDVEYQVQRTYERSRAWREAQEENARIYVETHPYLCECGRRTKNAGGLTSHRRSCRVR